MRGVVGLGIASTAVMAFLLLDLDDRRRLGLLGYLAVLSVPAALAVGSLVQRRVLLLPAAMLGVGMSPMLFSGIFFLLVPGIVYAFAFVASREPVRIPRLLAILAVVTPVTITALALAALLTGGTSEQCTSTVSSTVSSTECSTAPTAGSSALSLGLAVLAVVLGYILTAPPRRERRLARAPVIRDDARARHFGHRVPTRRIGCHDEWVNVGSARRRMQLLAHAWRGSRRA
jgi:hypothetical protein